MNNENLALYFHYPFCLKKCNYCDFASISGRDDKNLETAFLSSINAHQEILQQSKITTLFFGGGTPSLISEDLMEKIFKALNLKHCQEVTIEVNPASVDEEKIKFFKDIGVNRISIGIQALDNDDLKTLGRLHSVKDAVETVEIAQKYFSNVSADFIYGRPNQTLKKWEHELTSIKNLGLDHISMYQLSLENGWQVDLPSDKECEQMFTLNHDKTYGFEHYEISNYAKEGKQCKHNLAYWRYQNYLGIGAGAHSRINGQAMTYNSDVKEWLHTPKITIENLSKHDIFIEKLLMGLRTKDGLNLADDDYQYIDESNLQTFIDKGYITTDEGVISPTFKGFLFNDYIIERILKDLK